MKTGIKNTVESEVNKDMTAVAAGSGELEVLATPCLIALMEEAAYKSVAGSLPEGKGSVGTLIDIKHLAPTPVGMRIKVTSELIEVDGRRLVFKLEAYDEVGLIGEGRHERFIIDNQSFFEKAEAKLKNKML